MKQTSQRSLLFRQRAGFLARPPFRFPIDAPDGNSVPNGNFQLQRKEGVDAKKCVVTVARLQTSSIFMRDMYGRVNKKGWFKK